MICLAVAAGIYALSHSGDISKLKYNFPLAVAPNKAGTFFGVPVTNKAHEDTLRETAVPNSFYQSYFSGRPKVKIASLQFPSEFHPYTELVLGADLAQDEKIDISGWTVRGRQGAFTIPRAQKVYSFSGQESDIILAPWDQVHIYSGFGAKGNFQLTKCMGYLEDAAPFIPSVPRDCPYISRSEVDRFSGPCQQYALSLRVCEIPSDNPPVPVEDSVCREFLRNLNYNGCIAQHRNDPDFFENDWRVWVNNQMNFFDPVYDKVQLLDLKGNIVDEYIY